MAIEFSAADDLLVQHSVGAVLRRFKEGSAGYEETLGDLVDAIDLIATDDPAFRTYLQTLIDGE